MHLRYSSWRKKMAPKCCTLFIVFNSYFCPGLGAGARVVDDRDPRLQCLESFDKTNPGLAKLFSKPHKCISIKRTRPRSCLHIVMQTFWRIIRPFGNKLAAEGEFWRGKGREERGGGLTYLLTICRMYISSISGWSWPKSQTRGRMLAGKECTR